MSSGDSFGVTASPWGRDDHIGRLNWIAPDAVSRLVGGRAGGQTYDLAVDYFIGMPSWTVFGDPKFEIWMTHTPAGTGTEASDERNRRIARRYSYCGDAIAMYTHCGTHIDTLNHFGYGGAFWNGWTAEEHLGSRHWQVGGTDHYPPIIGRAVLLDVAGMLGVDCLPDSYSITVSDLEQTLAWQGTTAEKRAIMLIRTGRMSRWPDQEAYVLNSPGIGMDAARFLCEDLEAMCIGADNIGLEVTPPDDPESLCPVHCYMFARVGAPIMEVLNLEDVAAEKLYEFGFLGAPLKIRGATGAPIRPIGIPLRP